MKDAIKSWGEKVRSGKEELAKGEGNQIMPESLLSQIMLGYTPAEKAATKDTIPVGGLAKIFNENGIKFSKKTKVSQSRSTEKSSSGSQVYTCLFFK